MIQYLSTRGGISPVRFDEAVLQGVAADGGLFVPEEIPTVSREELEEMACLDYSGLAARLLRKFIDPRVIPEGDLHRLLAKSFENFATPETIPLVSLHDKNICVMELFHGPTLSFKDIAMGFLINTMDYFLTQKKDRLTLLLATTGDTGPAAAYASAGKKTIDCWPLYPAGMISEEQERQMTTLGAPNVHPVGVAHCKNGGDDLDVVVARMFSDTKRKTSLKLSSVNSINWCRVLVQTVHYFHGYLRAVDRIGEEVVFSVPTGAFGNLFGGYLARSMGLPVKHFICATNRNLTLHRLFTRGIFTGDALQRTVSSAIDIVVPYNFWRFLYFSSGCDSSILNICMTEFQRRGVVQFDDTLTRVMRQGFLSRSISDEDTLATMKQVYDSCGGYLLDPHGAVAVAAADRSRSDIGDDSKVICLATAHPAKFPAVVRQALGIKGDLPAAAVAHSLVEAKSRFQHVRLCDYDMLEQTLIGELQKSASS